MSLVSIEVRGQPQLMLKVKGLSDALDFTELLDQSAAILLNSIRDRFLRMLDSEGNPWLPSQASKNRESSGRGGGTLYDTGKLFHSIQLFAAGETSRAIGTDVPYGALHQYGAVGLPKREFLGISDHDSQLVQTIIIQRVIKALSS
jgi:phage virion morphogenesis protein